MAKYSEGDFIKGISGNVYRVDSVSSDTYYVTRVWSNVEENVHGLDLAWPRDHAESSMFSLLSTDSKREDTHGRSWTLTPGQVLKREGNYDGVFVVVKTDGIMVEDHQSMDPDAKIPGVNLVYIRQKRSVKSMWYRRVQWSQRAAYRELFPSEDEHAVKGGWELNEG